MNVGFDPGSHEMRVLFRRGQQLIARHCRSAYALLPDEPEHRQILVQSRLPFGTCDGHLVLLGDTVSALGMGLRLPTWPLFPVGPVEQETSLAREILVAELETLLPPAPFSESLCGFSFPVESMRLPHDPDSTTDSFLAQWIRLRGYTPLEITPARALILAELSHTGFTGLAVTFGAAYCSYSLCYRGEELVSGHCKRGGQWIDEQLAEQLQRYFVDSQGRSWLDTAGISAWKSHAAPSLLKPRNSEESLLRDLYRQLLQEVYQRVFDGLFEARLPRPFPSTTLVISGGVSRIIGFRELIQEIWLRPGLPLEIHDVTLTEDSAFTIARGCLIHACLSGVSEKAAA
ncbi:MAG: hypothetical protein JWM11_2354 [Planctomycetaceae bacterium]|nr:hypothetical protein [Planctomycetaceae bacterium]